MSRVALSAADLEACLRVLEAARTLALDDPQRIALERATAALVKSAKQRRRAARRQAAHADDQARLAQTARVQAAQPTSAPPPPSPAVPLHNARRCYVCKGLFSVVDDHYHQLCAPCAARNHAGRTARADLTGRRALLTGGRVKIGFALAGMLLRDGAHLIVTTRFPRDAAQRFAALPDFPRWRERLTIYGLDLRDLRAVLAFIEQLLREGRPLDILVNNAAQTVRRPPDWQAPWQAVEQRPLPPELRPLLASSASDRAPEGPEAGEISVPLDEEGLPLDLRAQNSWRLRLHEVEVAELAEVQVVNAWAPFLLCARLKPLLLASPWPSRYIVNASAVEGQFNVRHKTPRHPHTNMAKAALNMLVRTAAADYATEGIYMTSVDTGWVTDEDPLPRKQAKRARGFVPPLDVTDGAARLYDPIVRGVRDGEQLSGVFLKDYAPAAW